MINNKRIIGIIPARGGSKGLPEKNIRIINGKPLIAWTIEQAKMSQYLDTIFVSTDSPKIASVAEQFECNVPFLRPPEFAQDSSPTWEAVIHTLDSFEKEKLFFDYIALFEPTSPLRKKNDIDDAIEKLASDDQAKGLISVGKVHLEHPKIVKKITNNYVTQYIPQEKLLHLRQQADSAYFPYGVIYMCKVDIYNEEKTFYTEKTIPFFIERWQNYEIDDILDFEINEFLLKKYKDKIYG